MKIGFVAGSIGGLMLDRAQKKMQARLMLKQPTLSGQSTFAVLLPCIIIGFKSGEYTHYSKGIGLFKWRVVLVSFNSVLPRPLYKL
jgi:hypothetical protein